MKARIFKAAITSKNIAILPWLVMLAVMLITAVVLRNQGRLWLCSCDYLLLWSGNIWSADNSQHLFDPYSFTHALHGFAFCWLLIGLVPRLRIIWQLTLAMTFEALWEIVENSEFVIQRYREATLALGYEGDTIVNSLSDILLCGFGFVIARKLGFWRALLVFLATESILLIWIKDGLILNIVMLLYPMDWVKEWQMSR